jgi:hypothetical protein
MKALRVAIALVVCHAVWPGFALAQPQPRSPLLLVVPEEDTTVTGAAAYRLSASTLPGYTLSLNGKALKVYPSGATASLMNLEIGENRYLLTARSGEAVIAEKAFLIIRKPPPAATPMDTLRIEEDMLEPETSCNSNAKRHPDAVSQCSTVFPWPKCPQVMPTGFAASTGPRTR